MECTLRQFEDDAKLGQVAGTLKGRDQGHSGGPGQAGKTGRQEPHESQQRQMQSPAPGRK